MEKPEDHLYYKGYVAGYRDGASGTAKKTKEHDIADLPIEVMGVSTRARNCLSLAGCIYIADVAALSDYTIATMRNMGSKTASEVAHWLVAHGICFSAWNSYL